MSELDLILRVLVASVLGGLIGLERELKGHVAGLRTNILICLGSALFMIVSELMSQRYSSMTPPPDPTRIASTIVTGVGFIGAGIIFQSTGRIRNVTTAATVWVVAAIGMLVGGGFFFAATTGTLLTLLVLRVLIPLETWLGRRNAAAPGNRVGGDQPSPPDADA